MAKEKTSTKTEASPLSPAGQRLRETRHYFPEQGITITADTREEAEKELAHINKEEAADNPAPDNKEEDN